MLWGVLFALLLVRLLKVKMKMTPWCPYITVTCMYIFCTPPSLLNGVSKSWVTGLRKYSRWMAPVSTPNISSDSEFSACTQPCIYIIKSSMQWMQTVNSYGEKHEHNFVYGGFEPQFCKLMKLATKSVKQTRYGLSLFLFGLVWVGFVCMRVISKSNRVVNGYYTFTFSSKWHPNI